MTDHHPDAAEVLAESLWHTTDPRVLIEVDYAINRLSSAGFSIVRTGEVPPWMEPPQHLMDHDLTAIWYGDNDELIWTEAPREAWESIARPLYVIKEDD